MGLYDTLELPADLSLPGLERDPSTVEWQTKSIGRPAMRTFRVTAEGRLLEEEFHTERVPEEERPYYGTDRWDEPLFRGVGSIRHVHEGWSQRQYHGVVRFLATVDDSRYEYHAKFTDGRLVALSEDGDEGEWLPVEGLDAPGPSDPNRRDDARPKRGDSPRRTEDEPAYERTATTPLAETARAVGVSLPATSLIDTRHEERYLQVLHLPDDRERRDPETDAPIERGDVHELAVREPVTIEERDGRPHPVSRIVDHLGPYDRETALRRAVDLSETRSLPIHEEIVRLRPGHWTAASAWATCPDCASDELLLVTDLDDTGLTLACRACDARVTGTVREASTQWLHCPGCSSADVTVELSAPRGRAWWSCDDCGYDTLPAPVDRAYARARDEPPGD